MKELAWLVPVLPLVAWAVILLVGKRLPDGGAPLGILAIFAMIAPTVTSVSTLSMTTCLPPWMAS